MHHFFTLLLLLSLPVLSSAQSETTTPLEGTWYLTKAKWDDDAEHKTPEQNVYKIYTDRHFFFLYYNDTELLGAGGGTYKVDNNTFTEKLTYFSWDSTAIGTSQTYDWTLTGNTFHQSGLIKGAESYEDYVIDEYYERVEEDFTANPATDLVGVWLYKDGKGDTADYRTRNNIKTYKVITSKYFYFVFIDQDIATFDGAGFGTYTYNNGKYSETILAFSFDPSAVGKTFDFEMEITDNQFIQKGKMDTDEYENFSVRERYVRVE